MLSLNPPSSAAAFPLFTPSPPSPLASVDAAMPDAAPSDHYPPSSAAAIPSFAHSPPPPPLLWMRLCLM